MALWERKILCSASTLSYWESQARFSDTHLAVSVTSPPSCSKLTVVWSRTTPAGTREDFVTINMHLAVTAGDACAYLTDTQKADAEGDANTLMTAWQGNASNAFTAARYEWHDVNFGDTFYGPADRVTTISTVGANPSSRAPDQLSPNVTFRTASRKHWGRIYWPGISIGLYESTYGRVTNSTCDALASAIRTFANGLAANSPSVELIVYSHRYQAALSIDEIHCDNVPDVVRRRRAKMASYRKAYTS